ncbi:Protein ECERIFERUM 1 [Morella rubra]|uniref:Protein ECERIFERUM 1 n=1 Tax=Morella rubra TaxID=262757 RepID=A0A6A1WBM6_9ROSI|nr:Protein ECERIFERUM 1 [Morella rubra]
MPLYDYIYGTMDKSTDELYETSLKRETESSLDVVHLTHLTTPESIYHLRLGFASLASRPLTSKWHKESISSLIEDALLDAEERGAKVLSLGLLNQAAHTFAELLGLHSMLQGEEINRYGEVYVERNPKLNVKIVDGSSLAVALVLNSIPKGTTQVVLTGKLTKVAYALAFTLCQRGIQVVTLHEDEYLKLKKWLNNESESNLVLSRNCTQKTWLVGDELYEEEQHKAQKRTLFIPFSQFPPKQLRKDCFFYSKPAMVIPKSLRIYTPNWLPRRVMSAWRIAAIVHASEGWNEHECGYFMSNVDKVWQASLRHGFHPLVFHPSTTSLL